MGCNRMKKKKGITLLEVIITMSIMLLLMSLIYPIFLSGNKNLIKIDMERTLQIDSTTIENEISKLLVQSSGITAITDSDNLNAINDNIVNNIGQLSFNVEKDNEVYEYSFVTEEVKKIETRSIYKLTLLKSKVGESEVTSRVLSNYVEYFKVSTNSSSNFINSNYVKIDIKLYQKKGVTEVEHDIEAIFSFRNK